jgi:hypothetical protein
LKINLTCENEFLDELKDWYKSVFFNLL